MSQHSAPALHPWTHAIRQDQSVKRSLAEVAAQHWPNAGPQMPATHVARAPLVLSAALLQDLQSQVALLTAQLRPHLDQRGIDDRVRAADVLCLDFAVAHDAQAPGGWGLRCVEFQAFTSIVSSIALLHRASLESWPQLQACSFHDPVPGFCSWLDYARTWLAPKDQSVLLEHAPWSQTTRFDFSAARHLFGLKVVDLADVEREGRQLFHRLGGRREPIAHVHNRVVAHTTERPKRVFELLEPATVSWHSHPAWYYRISKALLPQLTWPVGQQCARADRWRELGLPAELLVLKACDSFGGKDVRLHVKQAELDGWPDADRWVVQPRYSPLALLRAADGAPVFGEIRCIVLLREGVAPWTVARFARLYRGDMASAAAQGADIETGVSVVLSPPEH